MKTRIFVIMMVIILVTSLSYAVDRKNVAPSASPKNASVKPTNPPSPPTMMKAQGVTTASGITLTWQDANGETGYILYRYEVGKGKQEIAKLPADTTSYIDKKDLKVDVKYLYTLTAYNMGGEASGQCEAMIPSGPPAAPTFFHASGPMATSSTTMELNWKDNSNNEDGFWIHRRPASQGNYLPTPIAKLGPNVTHYHDTGLEPETTYYYLVSAQRGGVFYSTAVETSGMTNPRPPENLTATALSSSEVKLSWKNSSKVAQLIVIERKTGNGGFGKIFQKEPIDISTYVDTGLKPGTSYTYRLLVLKLPFNTSDYTPAVSVTTP